MNNTMTLEQLRVALEMTEYQIGYVYRKLNPDERGDKHRPLSIEEKVLPMLRRIADPSKGRDTSTILRAENLINTLTFNLKGPETVLPEAAQAAEPVTVIMNTPGQETSGGDLTAGLLLAWAKTTVVYLFEKLARLTLLDWAFIFCNLVAVYGFFTMLREMGLALGALHFSVGIHALKMCKDPDHKRTAQAGIFAVFLLECLAWFAHFSMFNLRLWDQKMLLPLDQVRNIWIIACALATVFSAAAVYAAGVTFSLTLDRSEATEKRRKQEAEEAADRKREKNIELRIAEARAQYRPQEVN
jgi:hypothetical protein